MKSMFFKHAVLAVSSSLLVACGGGSDSSNPTPTPPPPPPNQAPIVDAGPDVQGNEGTSLVINGSARDNDGTISSYQWTQVSGPQVNANFTNTANPDVLLPLVDSDSIVVLRLTVTDDDGASSFDDVQITIINLTSGNTPPVVDAGDDITVSSGDNVSLVGTASDSDGSIVDFQWMQLSGPQVTINDSDSANASFTAPNVENDTTLLFQLTVTDDGGLDASDTLEVRVEAQEQNPSNGTLLIEFTVPEPAYLYDWNIDDDGSIYICSRIANESRNALQKINPDGDLVWRTSEDCFKTAAISNGNIVYMQTPDDDIAAINKESGAIEWMVNNIDRTTSLSNPSVAVLSNGDVIMHSNQLGVHAYNISGDLLWSTGFEATRGAEGLVATSDGTVLFVDLDGVLAIKDGSVLWESELSDVKYVRPHPDGAIAMSSDARQVYMLDWTNGEQKWSFADDGQTFGNVGEKSLVIANDKSIFLYASKLFKIDPSNGAVDYSVELPGGGNGGESLSMPTQDLLHVREVNDSYLVNPQGEIVELEDFVYRITLASNTDLRPLLVDYWVTPNNLTYILSKNRDPSSPDFDQFTIKVFSVRDEASNAIYSVPAGNLKRQNTVDIDVPVISNSYDIDSNGLLLKASASDVVLPSGEVNPNNNNPAYTFESNEAFSGSLSLSSDSIDTYAYIINAQSGEVLLENDDADGSTNSKISFNAQPGKYVAVASAFQDGFGDLKIEMIFDDDAEVEVKELRTDKKLNPGSSSLNPSSLAVQQDTFYAVNNVTQNPELEVVDPSNPVVGSGVTAQFTKEDLTYSTYGYTYTSCFDGGDSKIQFQTSSGQVTERNLASRSNTIYTTGGITDIGAPELSSTLIMTWVRLVTEVSESPPLAPGRDPQCEIDDFENDWVLYESTLNAKYILSQDGLESLMSNEHGVVATSDHFLDEENNFYGMYQGDNGDSFQLNVPNENLADFETLLESFRVDPNFNSGGGTQPADCESAWSGPDDPQFSPQCALACIYDGAGVEEGRAASCQILQNADPSYPGFCSACN